MFRLGALALGALLVCDVALAQDYPSRPIRFLQGFAPGGNADTISRVLAEEMSKTFKAGFVHEAKVGAGGNLASDAVAKAEPDGYSIMLFTTGHVISPALNKSLGFDPVEDFSFVSTVSEFPFFIVAGANSRFKSIGDLMAEARAKPGAPTVGTAGVGTGQHHRAAGRSDESPPDIHRHLAPVHRLKRSVGAIWVPLHHVLVHRILDVLEGPVAGRNVGEGRGRGAGGHEDY